jgi:hypothetical protein
VVRWDEVAARLRAIRGSTSQVEFGRKLRVVQNVVSRYETGLVRAPMEYLVLVAAHGRVTLDWLVLGPRPKTTR